MEYWNANVQGIRQVFDIKRYFIIHETRANSAECEINTWANFILTYDILNRKERRTWR